MDHSAWFGATCAAALAVLLLAVPPDPARAQQDGVWTLKQPLPAVRAEVAAVALDGRLHAVGGDAAGAAGAWHDEYDPKTNSWHADAPLPKPRDHVAVAVAAANGQIYAFGGFATPVHRNASADAFAFDPATGAWRVLPPMKVPRGSAGAATVDGRIHVIGGRGPDGIVVAAHEVFDPRADRWTEAAPLPKARDHMVVIVADGKIHVIGGRFTGPLDCTGEHDVYDPATDTWTTEAPLPTPRSGLAGATYRGMILVLGGELPGGTLAENEAYDVKAKRWATLTPMPHGRHGFGGDTIGNSAWFVGGSLTPGDGGATDQLLMFQAP
jgi:N-acetylneuraminic acid mutarotase